MFLLTTLNKGEHWRIAGVIFKNQYIMMFKVFKQMGKEIILNLDKIVFISTDVSTEGTIIYSTTHSNVVDESFEEVRKILGAGQSKEMGY